MTLETPPAPDDAPCWSLAIETSGRLGSAAIGFGGELRQARTFNAALQHGVELLPTVDALCREHGATPSEVREVYVSGGPGSFTGLRIGITFARSLAFATGARLVRIPTLEVIAQNGLEEPSPPACLAVLLDAKRSRVFAARFDLAGGRYTAAQAAAELEPDEFLSALPPHCAVLGEGVAYHRAAVDRAGRPVLSDARNRARAEVVFELGYERARGNAFDASENLIPIYVRRPEAEEVWEQRHGNA